MSEAGFAAAETLRAHDVDTLFTLSGGHLFPLYDGCVKTDIRLVDTRHEQTADVRGRRLGEGHPARRRRRAHGGARASPTASAR